MDNQKGFMYEKLSPLTIDHKEVTKKQKKEAKKRIKEIQRKVNERLKELEKIKNMNI